MDSFVTAALIAIAVYTVFNLIIGLGIGFDKEVVSTARGYFIGGGTQNFILFFTTVATWFSTGIYQGVVGSVYSHGIGWIGISTWQLLVVSLMGVLGPRFYTLGKVRNYITPSDLVGDYYGSKFIKLIISVGMMLFCIPSMMAQIKGVSWAVSGITNNVISFEFGVLYAAVIVGIYVYFGGFNSQAWVDTAQGIAFIIILWGSLIIVAYTNGGWSESWSRLVETAPEVLFYKDTTQYWNWRMYLSFFVLQLRLGILAGRELGFLHALELALAINLVDVVLALHPNRVEILVRQDRAVAQYLQRINFHRAVRPDFPLLGRQLIICRDARLQAVRQLAVLVHQQQLADVMRAFHRNRQHFAALLRQFKVTEHVRELPVLRVLHRPIQVAVREQRQPLPLAPHEVHHRVEVRRAFLPSEWQRSNHHFCIYRIQVFQALRLHVCRASQGKGKQKNTNLSHRSFF